MAVEYVAETGAWRGYVYLGSQLLAVQNNSAVTWVHSDPVTKSRRDTDGAGSVVSTVDVDPWGGETWRSSNSAFQPKKYTSYERDLNESDEAMMRRYNRWWSRFDQPDPYDGSYDLTDPQSLNRYAYTQNDPVNFIDPSGLDPKITPAPPLRPHPPNSLFDDYMINAWQQGWNQMYFLNPLRGMEQMMVRTTWQDDHIRIVEYTYLNFSQGQPLSNRGYGARYRKCLEEYRLDNVIRDVGKSRGHPKVGDFLAGMTVLGTISSLANVGMNSTRLGVYPRASAAGPAGTASSWQHGVSMRLRSALGMSTGNRWISSIGKASGRWAAKASGGLLAFEGGYEVGNAITCAAIARQ